MMNPMNQSFLIQSSVTAAAPALPPRSLTFTRELNGIGAGGVQPAAEDRITTRQIEHFLALIAQNLRQKPVHVQPEQHRISLADLVAKIARINFYELLGVGPNADEQEILAGYFHLARRVHPVHAPGLGLSNKEKILCFLFEKVTKAYLTLIDARKRCSYNLLTGIQTQAGIAPAKRLQEKRDLAAHYFRLARHYFSMLDFTTTIDLMREATRLDPQVAYFELLGRTLAKNPRWNDDAIASYQQAIALDPRDHELRLTLAQLNEKQGNLVAARTQYRKVLEQHPNHPQAQSALARLEGKHLGKFCGMSGLRTLWQSALS